MFYFLEPGFDNLDFVDTDRVVLYLYIDFLGPHMNIGNFVRYFDKKDIFVLVDNMDSIAHLDNFGKVNHIDILALVDYIDNFDFLHNIGNLD